VTRPRASHLLLLVFVGLLVSVVMLAVLLPKLGHLAPAPPTSGATGGKVAPRVAHRAGHHGWLTFGHVLLILAVSTVLSAVSLAGWVVVIARRRLAMRLSREYGLYEVKLSMHDQARPQDVTDMVEALLNAVREFPEQRSRDGQPFIAFEAHYGAGPDGEREWVLCVRCERALVETVDGILSSAYPNVRVGFDFIGPPQEIGGTIPVPGHVLRFRKQRSFVYPLHDGSEQEASSALEAVAQAQAAAGVPSTVRFQMIPCALPVERYARERLRHHEERLGPIDGGPIVTLSRAEMMAAAGTQDHAWCWLEVQIASQSRETCNRIAAVLLARRGRNRLQRRWMVFREDSYRERFPAAYPPILPSPSLRTLVSSTEIAQMLAFPGARLKNVPVRRVAMARIPAPPEIAIASGSPRPDLPPEPDLSTGLGK
jgi:hypothetical protein